MMDIVEERLREVEERQDKELKKHDAKLETHEEDIHALKAEQQNLKTDQQNLKAEVSQLAKSLSYQLNVSPTKKRLVPTVPSNQQAFINQPPCIIIERTFNDGAHKKCDKTRVRSTPCKGKEQFLAFKSVQRKIRLNTQNKCWHYSSITGRVWGGAITSQKNCWKLGNQLEA